MYTQIGVHYEDFLFNQKQDALITAFITPKNVGYHSLSVVNIKSLKRNLFLSNF